MSDCCDDGMDCMQKPVAMESQRNHLKVHNFQAYMQPPIKANGALAAPIKVSQNEFQPGQVTKIVFDRGLGESLGLDVECAQGAATLPIVALKSDGLASRSGCPIAVGDEILEVNGLRYDLETMMNICQTARYVEVVVARDHSKTHRTLPWRTDLAAWQFW